MDHTDQFIKIKDNDRNGFKAVVAVHRNLGNHVILGAPTVESLAALWKQFEPDTEIDRDRVQHVIIVKDTEAK